MASDPAEALIQEMRESFERLQTMVAELHPTDEADPAKAEFVADLKAGARVDAGRDRAARTRR